MSFRHPLVRLALALPLALPAGLVLAQEGGAAAETTPLAAEAEVATQQVAEQPAVAEAAHDAGVPVAGDAAAGKAKAEVCGACHGADGNSLIPMYPKLAGQNEAYIARQLAQFKSQQRDNAIMFGFALPLSTRDMHDLGAWFASQQPQHGEADAALVARGQALWRGGDAASGVPACMACHGPDGGGMAGAGYPHLAGQWGEYVAAKLTEWKDGASWGADVNAAIMPAISARLSKEDIAAVASYVQGLHTASGTPTASR